MCFISGTFRWNLVGTFHGNALEMTINFKWVLYKGKMAIWELILWVWLLQDTLTANYHAQPWLNSLPITSASWPFSHKHAGFVINTTESRSILPVNWIEKYTRVTPWTSEVLACRHCCWLQRQRTFTFHRRLDTSCGGAAGNSAAAESEAADTWKTRLLSLFSFPWDRILGEGFVCGAQASVQDEGPSREFVLFCFVLFWFFFLSCCLSIFSSFYIF